MHHDNGYLETLSEYISRIRLIYDTCSNEMQFTESMTSTLWTRNDECGKKRTSSSSGKLENSFMPQPVSDCMVNCVLRSWKTTGAVVPFIELLNCIQVINTPGL